MLYIFNAFRITGPLWEKSTHHWLITLTEKVSNAAFYVFFGVSLNERLDKQTTVMLPVIQNAMTHYDVTAV